MSRAPMSFSDLSATIRYLLECRLISTAVSWKSCGNTASSHGTSGLIHPESHFTDQKAAALRRGSYSHLRRHWQFINELQLFEIDHHVSYGIHIYGTERVTPRFLMASSLYHPETVERSLIHNGDGTEPGLKTAEGHWDTSAHADRILTIDNHMLDSWRKSLGEDDSPLLETPMVYTVNRASASALNKLAQAKRVSALNPDFSSGWHEKSDRQRGRFELRWGEPVSWDDVILQGPNFHVGAPLYKQPNSTMKNNLDWSEVDLEALPGDAVPVTSYKPIRDGRYDQFYTHWTLPNGDRVAARDYYRVAWRNMAANTGERTLIPAVIPPGTAHIHGVTSLGLPERSQDDLTARRRSVELVSHLTSPVRVAPKSTISGDPVSRLAVDSSIYSSRPDRIARAFA